MKDPTAFRQRVAAYKLGYLPYLAGRPIDDDEYFDTMEKVAIENNAEWNRLRREEGLREMSVDEEVMRVLNDHTYDYRGYYNKYPQNSANAKTHWTDEFKTYLHPTFSDLSRYAPNNPNYVGKTQFNPYEIEGGHWINNETEFVPSKDMLDLKKRLLIPTYLDGKTPKTDAYDPYILNKVFHNMNVPTGQCAEWANRIMDNLGYNTYGDAWLQHGNVLFNGYGNFEFPQGFDEKIYDQYSTQAADNLLKNFNSDAQLDKAMHYIVNMYYPESPNKKMAAENGNGFYGTHTGVLFYDKDGKWKVAHNIGDGVSEKNKGAGKIWVEDFKQMLSKTSHHRPTAIITPNKYGSLSRARKAIRNIFGFADGKSPYEDDRIYTTSDYVLPELVITPTKDSPEELAVEQAYLDRFKKRRLNIPVDNTAAQERWFRLGILKQRDAVHNSPWIWGLRGLVASPAAPVLAEGLPALVNNPVTNALLKFIGRPTSSIAEGLSYYAPSASRAVPYAVGFDKALMTTLGVEGIKDAGVKWSNNEMPWYQAVPQAGLSALMMTEGYPAIKEVAKLAGTSTVKAVDNLARKTYAPYDFYRIILETTPSVRVKNPIISVNGLEGADNDYIRIKSPLENLIDTKRGVENEAYYLFAPKDVDILKLRNARFGYSKSYYGPILGSGLVEGKFVSYGEPWMEFAPSKERALYEMPTGPRRGPSLMATDYRGNTMDYSVDEAYNAVLRDRQFHKDILDMKLDEILPFKKENYPDLIKGIPTNIYHANLTVIPNKNWNFDKFLKTPFWKYSEDPISGLVLKELFMRYPEANTELPNTILWQEAQSLPSYRPVKLPSQITADNAATLTDAEWDIAYNAALKAGDMVEAQRLRDLHFMAKAPNNQFIKESGEPFVMKHYGNKWTEFNPDETMDGVLWNADENAFKLDEIDTFEKAGLPTEWKNLFINMEKPIYDEVTNYTAKLLSKARKGDKKAAEELFKTYGVSNPDGLVKKLKLTEDALRKQGLDVSAEEIQHLKDIGVYNKEAAMSIAPYPNKIKLADAVTYDDAGNIIPLSKRDNFNINDIRYGLLPWILGTGTVYGVTNHKKIQKKRFD